MVAASANRRSPMLLPFQFVLLIFAGWVNRHQLYVIEYLRPCQRATLSYLVVGAEIQRSREHPLAQVEAARARLIK